MHLSVRQVDCKNHLSECTIHLSEIYKANATYVKIRNTQSSVGQVLQVFHLSDCHFYSSQTIDKWNVEPCTVMADLGPVSKCDWNFNTLRLRQTRFECTKICISFFKSDGWGTKKKTCDIFNNHVSVRPMLFRIPFWKCRTMDKMTDMLKQHFQLHFHERYRVGENRRTVNMWTSPQISE